MCLGTGPLVPWLLPPPPLLFACLFGEWLGCLVKSVFIPHPTLDSVKLFMSHLGPQRWHFHSQPGMVVVGHGSVSDHMFDNAVGPTFLYRLIQSNSGSFDWMVFEVNV